jgi:hypothetical protein
MDMRKLLGAFLLASLAAAAAACDNGGVELVAPDQATTTSTFSADVAKGGTNIFTFATSAAGEITIRLTRDVTADGLSTLLLVGLGTPQSDGTCSVPTGAVAALQTGTTTTSATIRTAGFGQFCVTVTDANNAGPVSYTIEVTHL